MCERNKELVLFSDVQRNDVLLRRLYNWLYNLQDIHSVSSTYINNTSKQSVSAEPERKYTEILRLMLRQLDSNFPKLFSDILKTFFNVLNFYFSCLYRENLRLKFTFYIDTMRLLLKKRKIVLICVCKLFWLSFAVKYYIIHTKNHPTNAYTTWLKLC